MHPDMSSDLTNHDWVEIETTINGKRLKCRVKARQHLADFLRQELELTGTHLGLSTAPALPARF